MKVCRILYENNDFKAVEFAFEGSEESTGQELCSKLLHELDSISLYGNALQAIDRSSSSGWNFSKYPFTQRSICNYLCVAYFTRKKKPLI